MFDLITVTLLSIITLYTLSAIFKYIKSSLEVRKYFEWRGLKYINPLSFFGNTLPVLLWRKNLAEVHRDFCEAFPNEPLFGFFEYSNPYILVQDPEYVEKILIKDFSHFVDHSNYEPDEKTQPVDHYFLFSMRGSKWRAFRYKLTPLFTAGKLKSMFEAYDLIGDKLLSYIDRGPRKEVCLKEAVHLFTMDYVGLSIFGLNSNCIENPGCEYVRMARQVFDCGTIKTLLMGFFPSFSKWLRLSFHNEESIKYFFKVIKEAFDYRRENNIVRNDFIQMMMQLKEKGKIEIHKWDPSDDYLKDKDTPKDNYFELSDIALMAQAYTFLTTGLDGMSTEIQYVLYELAQHPEVQELTRQEVLEQMKQHSGLTYDAIRSMTYLDKVVNGEILRLHPLVQQTYRVCTKDYTFPNGYTIKAGENLRIPGPAIGWNGKIHSEPWEFKPERFNTPLKPGTYFPFGDGPRVCLAMRFALMNIKYGVAKILSGYRVKLNPKTPVPLKLKINSVILEPNEPIYFDLEKI